MQSRISKFSLLIFCFLAVYSLGQSQQGYKSYVIAGISVEGNRFSDPQTIITLSGLRVSDQITLPTDSKINTAIKSLWLRKQFSDIDIIVDKITPLGVFLIIRVKEYSRLSEIEIQNNKELKEEDLRKEIGKTRGDIISPYDLYLTDQKLKKKYKTEGWMFANVKSQLLKTDTAYYAKMRIKIEEGKEFHTESITFFGNNDFSNSDLAGAFDKTHTKAWWQIWRSSKFDLSEYEKDKELLKKYCQKNGYRDFEIVKDTIKYNETTGEVHIELKVNEGQKLFVRNISFIGNTAYPSDMLLHRLEFKKGDPYDLERFQMNLLGNQDQSDANSLYLDNGYIGTQMNVEEKRVGKDSIDLVINVNESDRMTIRKVEILGNTKTKDKVIRRELYTRPGDYFNRSALIRSIKALGVLNYFNPEALQKPDVKIADKTKVDIVYKVEERSTDTFNASVGFAGTFGLTGSLGFSFNNFYILDPLKGGAGQLFNFNWDFGQANRYQSLAFGFTEPWLFDEPTTVGVSIYDTRINYTYDMRRTGASFNIGRRFRWPDDYFRGDWSIRYQINDVGTSGSPYYRPGKSTEVTISQTFSRISLDNIMFPTTGSKFSWSNEFAMGAIGLGTTDYLKSSLSYEANQPLYSINGMTRLSLNLSTTMGYIVGFKSDTTVPPIYLYYMGGNGLSGIGVTPLRGYQDRTIGPTYGGQVQLKHVAELRFAISVDPMPIYIYGFAEAGNVWSNLKQTDPFNLKRAAGIGLKLLINPIGLIGFSYGYGFDKIDATGVVSGWQFLFHLGNN